MKMEQTECSEMSAYEIQTLGNYTEESIQHVLHFFLIDTLHYVGVLNTCCQTHKVEASPFFFHSSLYVIIMDEKLVNTTILLLLRPQIRYLYTVCPL